MIKDFQAKGTNIGKKYRDLGKEYNYVIEGRVLGCVWL